MIGPNPELRKLMPLETDIKDLILAVSAKRTINYFGKFHYCKQHEKIVDKNHIDDCIYLFNDGKDPTFFNDRLNVIVLKQLDQKEYDEIVNHFKFLQGTLAQLIQDDVFVVVDRKMQL